MIDFIHNSTTEQVGSPYGMTHGSKTNTGEKEWLGQMNLKHRQSKCIRNKNPPLKHQWRLVKDIADELGESPNGVRMILTKAGVYVRKTPAAKSSGGSTGGGRVSVADAQASLTSALSDAGQEVDEAIYQ